MDISERQPAISWHRDLLPEETRVPGENYRSFVRKTHVLIIQITNYTPHFDMCTSSH
jgi:hypothetical protein